MNDARASIIIALFSIIPYLLVSWAYMESVGGESKQFWGAFGVLIAVRFVFSVIETIGSILAWRVYGKKLMINKFLDLLWANNFPKREYQHEDFPAYLARIEAGGYADSVKISAKEFSLLLSTFENMGVLQGMRIHAASEAALDTYSPKSEAPIYGAPTTL